MSYQDCRGFFEKTIHDALVTGGIATDKVFFDNYGETPPGADTDYAIISLSFTDTVADVLGCEGQETLQGSILVNVYTKKQRASKPGEDICGEVIKGLLQVNKQRPSTLQPLMSKRVFNMNGPQTLASNERPHHAHVVTCNFRARVA